MAKSVAKEMGPRGIRANSIAPGTSPIASSGPIRIAKSGRSRSA